MSSTSIIMMAIVVVSYTLGFGFFINKAIKSQRK